MNPILNERQTACATRLTAYNTQSEISKLFSSFLCNMPQATPKRILNATWINTVLGPMIAIGDDNDLYLLDFFSRKGLEHTIARLSQKAFSLMQGITPPLATIEAELKAYFEGHLTQFKTPYRVFGSPFQQQAWNALCQIPFGETRSYAAQAAMLGKPKSYRAVGNANGANRLAIIIPCHRVIATDGTLGGYGGGLPIKQWLIAHEKHYKKG